MRELDQRDNRWTHAEFSLPQNLACGCRQDEDWAGTPNQLMRFGWREEERGCHVSEAKYTRALLHILGCQERRCVFLDAEYFQVSRSGCGLPNHRRHPANDDIPVLACANRNDRLDVQYILSSIKRANAKVAVVLD